MVVCAVCPQQTGGGDKERRQQQQQQQQQQGGGGLTVLASLQPNGGLVAATLQPNGGLVAQLPVQLSLVGVLVASVILSLFGECTVVH